MTSCVSSTSSSSFPSINALGSFGTTITTIQDKVNAETTQGSLEAFKALEEAYQALITLTPTSPAEVQAARTLEAYILGRYGRRCYPNFEPAAYYSAMAVKILLIPETSFTPQLKELTRKPPEFRTDELIHTTPIETALECAHRLDPKTQILFSDTYFTLLECYCNLTPEALGLSGTEGEKKSKKEELIKKFKEIRRQTLEQAHDSPVEVDVTIKGTRYQVTGAGRRLAELYYNFANSLEGLSFEECLELMCKYNPLPEMKARKETKLFLTLLDKMDRNNSHQWSNEDKAQLEEYITTALTTWEEIIIDLHPYSAPDKERYNNLYCHALGNCRFVLTATNQTEKRKELDARYISIAEQFIKSNPDDPYCLIHSLNLARLYHSKGQNSDVANMIKLFRTKAEKHSSWEQTQGLIAQMISFQLALISV